MGPFNSHYLTYLAESGAVNLHAFGSPATARLLSALALTPGQRVLEIGCGTGATLVQLPPLSGLQIDGVDFLEKMLDVARLRIRAAGIQNVRVMYADVTATLPFADGVYDAVFTESVLGIQPDFLAIRFLREVARVLRPGGRFVANEGVWQPGAPPAIISSVCQNCVEDFGFALASEHGWTWKDWSDRMTSAGLTVLAADLLENGHRPLPQPLTSRLITAALYMKPYLIPRLIRQRRRYSRLLERHREDTRHIEMRLFVAQKFQ